jgi:hypothetical protein
LFFWAEQGVIYAKNVDFPLSMMESRILCRCELSLLLFGGAAISF